MNALISVAFENDNYGLDKYRIGGEVSYMNSLFLRAGYLYSTNLYGNESIFQDITVGFGVDLKEYVGIAMGFDYAYVPVRYFDANHLFDIRIDF
jgi:hypothetical protein